MAIQNRHVSIDAVEQSSIVLTEGDTMMPNELHNGTDLEQLIKDARYARIKFVRENFRVFAYGSSLLGLLCAFAITVLLAGSANRYEQASTIQAQISPVAKVHK